MGGGLAGQIGSIKWGHYTAAAILGYVVTPKNRALTEWTLTATVVLADAFKMAQSPLVFTAKHAKGEWRFPITAMDRRKDGLYQGPFYAQLGPPEARR